MKNVREYNAAPDASKFHEVDAAALAEIIREIRSLEHTATTEWARDGWETDIDASTRAAELMDSFGHRVYVAQDEDGYYFATELVERNKCEECGAEFGKDEGFCGDDMVLCRACSLKYAETHPDEIQVTGRSF